jgi:hypothetical protein
MFSSPAALFGSLRFGAIGLAALLYSKTMVLYKPVVIGFVLMNYPYFVAQTWLMYIVRCAFGWGFLLSWSTSDFGIAGGRAALWTSPLLTTRIARPFPTRPCVRSRTEVKRELRAVERRDVAAC